jgi:hypothetical protein
MTENKSYGPTRFLTNAVTLLLLLSVAFGAYLVVWRAVGAVRGGQEVAVHLRVPPRQVEELPESFVVPDYVEVVARQPDASPRQLGLALARDVIPALLFIPGLFLARQILRSARDGNPFIEPNIHRLRLIGFLLMLTPLATLLSGMADAEIRVGELARFNGPGAVFSGDAILAGLGVFVLAQVFAHGVRLREDVEGTV